jgi:type IV pilus assembly protein PilM
MAKIRRGRAKRLVLDIGSSSVRLCELTQTKAGYQLTKYYQRDLSCDPAQDEETRRKARIATIKALVKEARVRTRKTIISVPGRSVFTRARTLPPVPEYKVSQIVGYEIRQQIPFPLEQIALDYQILNRTESGSYDVMMAAIKVDVVEKHLDILRETKSTIDVVDVSPFAAYNWLKHTGEFGADGECVALLDLGATTTEIVIERGNQFRFTRPLNMGGNDITNALAAALGASFSDAEKFKRERAFAPTGDPARDGKMGEVLGPVLTRLVGEISRSFGYFRSLPGGGMVDRVIVTGGGACLRNIVPFLQRQLGIEVRIARPLAGLAVGANAQQANEHPEQACVALGMALRCCQTTAIEINLIPPRIQEAARRKEQALYWVLSFIVLAMIAASIIPARDQKDRQVVQRIKEIKKVIGMYDGAVAENPDIKSDFETQYEDAKKRINENQDRIAILTRWYKNAEFYLDELKLLNDLRPEGSKIWFSSVETTIIAQGGSGAGGEKSRSRLGGGMDDERRRSRRDGGGTLRPDTLGGITSTGFTGISSGASEARMGADGGFGRRNQGPGKKAQQPVAQAPMPNGIRIMGYAKDDQALLEFYDNLVKYDGTTPKIEKVYFSQANAAPVPITEMDVATVADRPIARSSSSLAGTRDEERRGGFSGGAGGRSPGRSPAASNMYNPYVETVVFFKLDVQFVPFPAAPEQPAPGASPFGTRLKGGEGEGEGEAGGDKANPFSRLRDKNKGADTETDTNPLKKARGEADEG